MGAAQGERGKEPACVTISAATAMDTLLVLLRLLLKGGGPACCRPIQRSLPQAALLAVLLLVVLHELCRSSTQLDDIHDLLHHKTRQHKCRHQRRRGEAGRQAQPCNMWEMGRGGGRQ